MAAVLKRSRRMLPIIWQIRIATCRYRRRPHCMMIQAVIMRKSSLIFAFIIHQVRQDFYISRTNCEADGFPHDLVLVMKEGLFLKIGVRVPERKKLCWFHSDLSDVHWIRHFFKSKEEERTTMAQYDQCVCVVEVVKQNILRRIENPENLIVLYTPIHVHKLLKKAEEPISILLRSGIVYGEKVPCMFGVCQASEREWKF